MNEFHKYRPKYRAFKSYWRAYGGWVEVLNSPWLGFAVLFAVILFPIWTAFDQKAYGWIDIVFSTIPSLLGFSLGAVAILLGFSSGPKKALHKLRGEASYYLLLIASFFHFIFLQFLTLISALCLMAYPNIVLSGVSFFLFTYSIFSGLGAAAAVYSMSEIYDKSERVMLDKER